MPDEIRKVLQEAVTVRSRSLQPDELWKRGNARRVRRGLAVACASVIVAVASWSFSGTLITGTRSPESVEPGGGESAKVIDEAGDDHYIFSNVRVEASRNDQQAKVLFDMEWSGDQFPGLFECTWTVYDSDGAQVGERTDALPLARFDDRVTDTHKLVKVAEPGKSADVSCDSERLDNDPDPSYHEASPGSAED